MTAAHDVLRSDVVRIRDDIENSKVLRHDDIVDRLEQALARDNENSANELPVTPAATAFTDEEQQQIRRVLNGVPGMAFAMAGQVDTLEELLTVVNLMSQFLQGKFDYIADLEHKVDRFEADKAALRRLLGTDRPA